ncbi:MAG: hypothetical protein CFH01_00798 [Alphaproteobacteria bacterium MarineAlpha2_Bin1]|nr:MAG: hypothetical protein CFH01_00798 [Alphaproteobacteria bacterium MarineAlpha2_Bin1]|tara:strand:- start:271 stop:945 length:675 start_codon:yes stop_codon:yes gene_type:complete
MNILRRSFRTITILLAIYFWWLGIGNGLYVGASTGYYENWGGGFRYLTNWVLTLNLLVASNAIFNEFYKRSPLNLIIPATLAMNFVVIILYWGLRVIDKSYLDVNTENWTLFEWFWDFYLHWGMSILVLIEILFFKKSIIKISTSYLILMIIFLGYIFWIELFIMPTNNHPCGKFTCGFPYPFLNEMKLTDRSIFYTGVWFIGTLSYIINIFILRINQKLNNSK